MDPTEITKHLPEAVSVAKVAAASIPFTGIVKRMLGPAADEVAEMWRDQVRLYRYERQLKCVEKAERLAQQAGFTPQAVPPKILFPLLEGASFEDDETLHDMWAALLTNAASPENAKKVRPGFIADLKQMSPEEAALLNWMVSHEELNGYSVAISLEQIAVAYNQLGFGPVDVQRVLGPRPIASDPIIQAFGTCFTTVVSNGFARRVDQEAHDAYTNHSYHVTWRGGAFIQACRPPNP